MKKRMIIISAICLGLSVVMVATIGAIGAQNPRPYRETALKASYDSMEALEADIEISRKRFANYIKQTENKLSGEEFKTLQAEWQSTVYALRQETLAALSPYERTRYQVQQAADTNIDSKKDTCIVTFQKICYDYALSWLEQYRNSGRDHYYTIFFAVRESWEICEQEKGCRQTDPPFEDRKYAEDLMQSQLERGKKIEDALVLLSMEQSYAFLNELDEDARREMRGGIVDYTADIADISTKDVEAALQTYMDIYR